MAIYHLSMKPVSRANGRSAVASMAYRAGERLTNKRDGITHDYTAKKGVEHAEIVLPEGVSADTVVMPNGIAAMINNSARTYEKGLFMFTS